MLRAFYAPRAWEGNQILQVQSFKSVDIVGGHSTHARQKRRGCTIGHIRPDVAVLEYNRHPEQADRMCCHVVALNHPCMARDQGTRGGVSAPLGWPLTQRKEGTMDAIRRAVMLGVMVT